MTKTAHLSKGFTALLFILLSQFLAANAFATAQIYASALQKKINVTSCQSCHTGSAGQEGIANLKPNYQSVYKLDPTGLTRLKNLINGCPSGQLLTPTFLCVQPVTVSQSAGSSTTGAAATDVYAVTCGTGTAGLYVAVKDLAPAIAPLVSIQAVKGFASSPLSTDTKDGDAIFSPQVKLAGGAGVYNVQVNKDLSSTKGSELYTARFVCLNAAGAKTVTSTPVPKQNQ